MCLSEFKKASTSNNHFSSVAQALKANIPNLPDDPTANVKRIRISFFFLNTDAEKLIMKYFHLK